MAQEARSIGLPAVEVGREPGATHPPQPLQTARLVLSLVLIALSAVAFASLLAACFVLLLYAHGGTDGVAEFYEEFRLDLRLKTLVSSVVVGALYLGVAASTVSMARLHARVGWPALLAWSPARKSRWSTLLIFGTTLAYGIAATSILALTRTQKVLVAGNTDIALLATITTNLVLLAPIAEELLFRGWLYTALRARLPFWPSFLVTGSLFAATHWGAGVRRILLVIPLAAALGALRELTGSIKPTIALHSVYNLVVIALTLLES